MVQDENIQDAIARVLPLGAFATPLPDDPSMYWRPGVNLCTIMQPPSVY